MLKILLDTNFLLIPVQFKVDIFVEFNRILCEPYELYVLDKTVEELNSLQAPGHGKVKMQARLGLLFIEKKKIKVLASNVDGHTDDVILSVAKNSGYCVATQDIALRKQLRAARNPYITLRQKSYLVFEKFK